MEHARQEMLSLETMLSMVEDHIRKIGPRRLFGLVSARQFIFSQFALDLCLVALGVRSGYLPDTFIPPDGEQCLRALLEQLSEISKLFIGLKLVCTADQQLFIVNASLLREKVKAATALQLIYHQGGTDVIVPSFVLLDKEITMVPSQQEILHIAARISDLEDRIITLPSDLTSKTLVPLAGFLLDYPACYAPVSNDQSTFLSAVPLDAYDCSLIRTRATHSNIPASHRIMRFTCPVDLGTEHLHLSPQSLTRALNGIISHRLLSFSADFSLEITHTVVTLDRVAL